MSPGLKSNINFKKINTSKPNQLYREKLIKWIFENFAPGKVLNICADTGYGKSILINQLFEKQGINWCLIDLRKISQSPITFLKLITTCFKKFCINFSVMELDEIKQVEDANLHSWLVSNFEIMLDELVINASHSGVIVFDSLERLGDGDIRKELINLFLDRLPEFIGFIFISRTPLKDLYLSRLKSQGRLLELNNKDLAFDKNEIEQFLCLNLPERKIDKNDIEKVYKLTGGWPVAVDLLIKELPQKEEIFIEQSSSPSILFKLLQEEVWSRLCLDEKRYLSILALCAPCDKDVIEEVVDDLIDSSICNKINELPFVERSENGQLQLPEFFQKFLYEKLPEIFEDEERRSLYLRLGEFYYFLDPVRAFYFFKNAKRIDLSLKLFKKYFNLWIKEGKWSTIFSLAEEFNDLFRQKHPELFYFLGITNIYSGHILKAIPYLEKAQDFLPIKSKMATEAGLRLAEALLVAGRAQEAATLCEALVSNTIPFSPLNIEAKLLLAISYNQINDKRNNKLWKQIERIATTRFAPIKKEYRTYILTPKAIFFHFDRGEFKRGEEILDSGIDLFSKNDPLNRFPLVLMFKGIIKREILDYEQSIFYLREAIDVSSKRNRSIYSIVTALLSLTLCEQGKIQEAQYWIKEARRNQKFDETYWTECFCLLSQLYIEDFNEKETLERLFQALSIATDKENTYLLYNIAITGFKIRSKFSHSFVKSLLVLLEKLETESKRLGIKHRFYKSLLLKWQLLYENPLLDINCSDDSLKQALKYLKERELDFLISKDASFDHINFYRYCLRRKIESKFVLDLWLNTPSLSIKELIKNYDIFPTEIKIDLVEFWQKRRIRSALTFLNKLKKELSKNQEQDKKRIQRAIEVISNSPPEPLSVFTLGRFKVLRPYFHISNWKRQKAKEIFKFLLIKHGKPVSTYKLVDIFWPDTDFQKAKKSLWSAISALRGALEPELPPKAKSSYIFVQDENYVLRLPEGSFLDFEEFEQIANKGILMADKDEKEALKMFEKAKKLYKGEFLPEDIYEQWSVNIRERLKIIFQDVLKRLAKSYLKRRHFSECISTCYTIIEIDPWDELAYLILMKALVLQGQEFKALKVFDRCHNILTKELGIEPSQELNDFRNMILSRRAN